MQPGGTVALGAPPTGYSWVIGWVSHRTIRQWALVVLGGVLVVGSLSGLGVADIIRMMRDRRKSGKRR